MIGPTQIDAHVLRATGLVVGPHLLANRRLHPRRRAPAAPLLRPGHAQEAALGQRPAEGLGDLEIGGIVGEGAQESLGHVLGDERAQVGAHGGDVVAQIEVHVGSP